MAPHLDVSASDSDKARDKYPDADRPGSIESGMHILSSEHRAHFGCRDAFGDCVLASNAWSREIVDSVIVRK